MIENTRIIRNRITKKAILEVSIELVCSKALKDDYEAVTPSQHLGELNILGSNARLAAKT